MWSINEQKILLENDIETHTEIRENIIFKVPISHFGNESEFFLTNYPDLSLLVYIAEPWKYVGIKV
jgi:hypothetical protein